MTRAPVLLVVDDEPNILELIDRIVRPLGFATVLHDNAVEALARLTQERPDIALVDLRMPGTGGLDVLRMIRRVRPECAVILMTGQASVDTAIEAVKLGALDFLTKPLDIQRLRQRLGDARNEAARRAGILESDSREDFPYLTPALVKEFATRFAQTLDGVSPGAERLLMSAEWRGNVRELRNVLERASILAEDHVLTERGPAASMPSADSSTDLDFVERQHIARVLADVRGNKVVAARRLGISRRTLYRRLEHHGLLRTLPDRTRQ